MLEQKERTSYENRIDYLEKELKDIKEKLWCPDCELPRGAAMLSDRDILSLINKGRIVLSPLPDLDINLGLTDLGTCKVDLRLGKEVLIPDPTKVTQIDLSEPIPEEYFIKRDVRKEGKLIIPPNHLLIAVTLEKMTLADDLYARMEGKSGIARRGGAVQLAAIFDAGWDGHPMMELHNVTNTPIIAHYGQPICAMSFGHLSSPTLRSYIERNSTYKVQTKARI